MEPSARSSKLNFRADPALKDRIEAAAADRFQGIEAMLMRDAIEMYLDLRDAYGPDFDRIIANLLSERELTAIPA